MRHRARRRWWWRLWASATVLMLGGSAVQASPPDRDAPAAPAAVAPAACSEGSPTLAAVRTYARPAVTGLPAGTSRLYCGNARFGLRHIAIRHTADWRAAATRAGVTPWQGFVDLSLGETLARPQSVRCDPVRDSCAFRVAVANSTIVAVVVVARADGKIITAYPAG